MRLEEIVDGVFGVDGYLARHLKGYQPSTQQLEYAQEVAKTLQAGKPAKKAVALLEAETGTGKTLGYLVPLLAWAAINNRRVAIATASNQLQEQITAPDGNLALATNAIASITGVRLSSAVRFGLHNFISPARAKEKVLASLEEGLKDDPAIINAFTRWLDSGETLLSSHWLDAYDRFPLNLSIKDVACQHSDDTDALRDYHDHADAAKQVDVVVISHVMALLYGINPGVLDGEKPITALVVDEADRMPDMAAALFNEQIPLSMLRYTTEGMFEACAGKPGALSQIETLASSIERLDSLLRAYDPGDTNILLIDGQQGGAPYRDMTNATAKVTDAITAVAETLKRSTRATEEEELLATLSLYARSLDRFSSIIKGAVLPGCFAALSWSPILRQPSLQVLSTDPGQAFSRTLLSDGSLCAAILTSATLGDGREDALPFFGRTLGIFDGTHNVVATRTFSIEDFGNVEFVLTQGEALPTLSTATEIASNPEWFDNLIAMIQEAAQPGHRVLVLTLSMRDTQGLTEALQDTLGDRLIPHLPGVRLGQCLAEYRRHTEGILVSPSAWEGVDLPGMIDDLVISRLPFAPPDGADKHALVAALKRRGFTEEQAKRVVYAQSLMNSRRKFRQGVGRGVRQATDSVTIWIADPRFPPATGRLPIHRSGVAFSESLPKRFIEQRGSMPSPYHRARIFGEFIAADIAGNPW